MSRWTTCSATARALFSSARIPWPRVQPVGQRGGCGLLVNEELARAIRTESAAALKCHFGASQTTIWAWRKCFEVGGYTRTLGTRTAHHAASKLGAAAVKAKEWSDEGRSGDRARSGSWAALDAGERWLDA